MTESKQAIDAEQKNNIPHDDPEELLTWIDQHRSDLVGEPVVDDLYRCLEVNHTLSAESVRFDAEAGTLSIKLWNPGWWQAETIEEYSQACIDAAPNGYHMHFETEGDSE